MVISKASPTGHCRLSKVEFINERMVLSPTHVSQPAKKLISQLVDWFGFFVLMAYQHLYVIYCQSHSPRRTVVVLFNP